MLKRDNTGYNKRLFSGGLRGRLHWARFVWLKESLTRWNVDCNSVLELGCFDGKVIDFLSPKPERYLGLDANWEGGLDTAIERWAETTYEFRYCEHPDQMQLNGEQFNLTLAMETMEHISPPLMDLYFKELAAVTRHCLIITVPNEIGPIFLLKFLTKRLAGGDLQHYSFIEIINQTLGRAHRVRRNQHKGFDFRRFVESVRHHFDVVEVSGIPFKWLPPGLNFGIGIVAAPRSQ